MPGIRAKDQFRDENFNYIIDIDFQIYAFYEYIKLTEQIIEKEIKEKIAAKEKEIAESDDPEMEIAFDYEEHLVRKNISSIYYTSILLSLFIFRTKIIPTL
jgi:hypothetical protein